MILFRTIFRALTLGVMLFSSCSAWHESQDSSYQLHGFLNQSYLKSSDFDYLVKGSQKGSFKSTEFGLNVSYAYKPNVHFAAQGVSMNFGEKRKFKPQLDFAFGDWHIYPELGVRLGRVRFPMGLHNEYRDVDFARSSIFLNQGIYPEEFRPFVNAFDGISFYGDLGSQDHDWLNLSYQLSAGTMSVPSSFYYNDTIQNTLNSKHSHLDTDYIWSFQFKWESPIDGLELGYNYSSLNMNIDVSSDSVLDSGAAVSVDEALDFEVHVSILSLLYQLERWTFQAEKMIFQIDMSSTSRYRDALSSINPALAIGQDTLNGRFSRDLEAWSLMLEYETDDFGLPFLMLSDYTNDRNSNGDYWTHRKDITLGIRYDINSHWVLKAEHHWMEGTAMMDSLGQSTSQLEKHWTFFALRMGLNF